MPACEYVGGGADHVAKFQKRLDSHVHWDLPGFGGRGAERRLITSPKDDIDALIHTAIIATADQISHTKDASVRVSNVKSLRKSVTALEIEILTCASNRNRERGSDLFDH
jgi:hypothetical protein